MATRENDGVRRFLFSKSGLVVVGFLAVAGYYLWAEHKAHILAYLPVILILGLCLGMHFFMHGGHGGGSDADDPDRRNRRAP